MCLGERDSPDAVNVSVPLCHWPPFHCSPDRIDKRPLALFPGRRSHDRLPSHREVQVLRPASDRQRDAPPTRSAFFRAILQPTALGSVVLTSSRPCPGTGLRARLPGLRTVSTLRAMFRPWDSGGTYTGSWCSCLSKWGSRGWTQRGPRGFRTARWSPYGRGPSHLHPPSQFVSTDSCPVFKEVFFNGVPSATRR